MGDDATAGNGKPPKNTTGKTVNGVRNGQRKPFKKATRVEVEQRVEWLAEYLADKPLASRTEIHRVMRERYDINWWVTDLIYLNRAREILSKRANMTKQEAKELGVNLLIKLAKSGRDQIKVAAEKRLGEIYGYNAPTHVRVGDPNGKPMAPTVIAPTVQFIFPQNSRRDAQAVISTNGNGHNGNGHIKAIAEHNGE